MSCCDAFIRRGGVGGRELKKDSKEEDVDEQGEGDGEEFRDEEEDVASRCCCKGGVGQCNRGNLYFSSWVLFFLGSLKSRIRC